MSHTQKIRFCHILLNNYFVDLTNRSISNIRSFLVRMSENSKEWWIGKKWGLGVGLTYSKTKLTNEPGNEIVEKLNSNRFGILLNATFN